ncbi:MAG: GNAT family N-acetyltransferase [Deltaproteobacteria bacterium]|nr:GNAT family N-acetyltransferase [Deltaproteobacteria bacterium]
MSRRIELLPLGARDIGAAMTFAAARPAECALIAGWIHDGGLTTGRGSLFALRDEAGAISSLVFMSTSGILVPVLNTHDDARIDAEAAEAAAKVATRIPGMLRVIVGRRSCTRSVWARLEGMGLRARMSRDQVGYVTDASTFERSAPRLELKAATKIHLDALVETSAAMAREEAQDDPQARNPSLFRARIEERMLLRRDLVFAPNGQLLFKCNISALSNITGQVEGIYTVPKHRGRGIGKRGTASATEWVLNHASAASLLVNDDNDVAIRMYESLGYRPVFESQTIFVR